MWEVEPNQLDYGTYLPMFFGGLIETEEPHALFARRGILDMLHFGDDESVAEAVPLLVPALRDALQTEDIQVCVVAIECLQTLLQVGKKSVKAMLPFFKNLLPCFRRILLKRTWSKYDDNKLDDAQRGGKDLQTIVEDTLHILHRHGGQDAYKLIRAMVPMYQAL